jgi:hypothetical protein
MELPHGMKIDGEQKQHLLLLRKSLYGLKQSLADWHEFSSTSRKDLNYEDSRNQSLIPASASLLRATEIKSGAQTPIALSGTKRVPSTRAALKCQSLQKSRAVLKCQSP